MLTTQGVLLQSKQETKIASRRATWREAAVVGCWCGDISEVHKHAPAGMPRGVGTPPVSHDRDEDTSASSTGDQIAGTSATTH
eukprot:522340-Amphidinium_carterae.1